MFSGSPSLQWLKSTSILLGSAYCVGGTVRPSSLNTVAALSTLVPEANRFGTRADFSPGLCFPSCEGADFCPIAGC